MNVNEGMLGRGRNRGRGRFLRGRGRNNVVSIQNLRGPLKRPTARVNSSVTSSSSNIIWNKNTHKVSSNNSTLFRTSSSSKSYSSEKESRVIIALSEGRGEATCEVGIAAIDVSKPSLILCQIGDTQSYINTLTKINILNPNEILIPITFVDSSTNRLIEKLKENFQEVKITAVARCTFNSNLGMQYVKELCAPAYNPIILILEHRYYALAATAALLNYTEFSLNIVYANESMKVEYQESEGYTIIDFATADRLELVAPSQPNTNTKFSSLLGILNYCITKIGTRTLRSSILQPPCSIPDIETRLDCVTELMQNSEMLLGVQSILTKIVNIDQLLSLAAVLPDDPNKCTEKQLNYIILLNSLLEVTSPLHDILDKSKQPFFVKLRETLSSNTFVKIKECIRTLVHKDAHMARGQNGIIQRCFAIKTGVSGFLDLVRKSYSEKMDEMREYVKNLGETHNLQLSLNNNYKKGYHISLHLPPHQRRTFKKSDLPPEFIQVERLSSFCTMKTNELINYSSRIEDIEKEILKLSNKIIHEVLLEIRKEVRLFYELCEDIAKLDMLQSLAQASASTYCVRPKFGDYLDLKHSRHPMLEFLCPKEPVANSVFASKYFNLHIITGPNGSGKSIYIRQILLLQVMAQVGSYVPAFSATFRVADRILARVYLGDNMLFGASAFVLEMKEIQYFFSVMTKNTLIIIDELCRSTSVEEGTAIAMSICEKLIQTPAFTFITTHYIFLTKLYDLYYQVKTWQMKTILKNKSNGEPYLDYTYSVTPGVNSLQKYGIYLAKISWHEVVMKYVEEILEKISNSSKFQSTGVVQKIDEKRRIKYNLEAEFYFYKQRKELTREIIVDKMIQYQEDLKSHNCTIELSSMFQTSLKHFYNEKIDNLSQNHSQNSVSNTLKSQENCENETVSEYSYIPVEATYSQSTDNINIASKTTNANLEDDTNNFLNDYTILKYYKSENILSSVQNLNSFRNENFSDPTKTSYTFDLFNAGFHQKDEIPSNNGSLQNYTFDENTVQSINSNYNLKENEEELFRENYKESLSGKSKTKFKFGNNFSEDRELNNNGNLFMKDEEFAKSSKELFTEDTTRSFSEGTKTLVFTENTKKIFTKNNNESFENYNKELFRKDNTCLLNTPKNSSKEDTDLKESQEVKSNINLNSKEYTEQIDTQKSPETTRILKLNETHQNFFVKPKSYFLPGKKKQFLKLKENTVSEKNQNEFNTSVLSINEKQFSISLQNDKTKTSTPIVNVKKTSFSEPFFVHKDFQKPTFLKEFLNNKKCNTSIQSGNNRSIEFKNSEKTINRFSSNSSDNSVFEGDCSELKTVKADIHQENINNYNKLEDINQDQTKNNSKILSENIKNLSIDLQNQSNNSHLEDTQTIEDLNECNSYFSENESWLDEETISLIDTQIDDYLEKETVYVQSNMVSPVETRKCQSARFTQKFSSKYSTISINEAADEVFYSKPDYSFHFSREPSINYSPQSSLSVYIQSSEEEQHNKNCSEKNAKEDIKNIDEVRKEGSNTLEDEKNSIAESNSAEVDIEKCLEINDNKHMMPCKENPVQVVNEKLNNSLKNKIKILQQVIFNSKYENDKNECDEKTVILNDEVSTHKDLESMENILNKNVKEFMENKNEESQLINQIPLHKKGSIVDNEHGNEPSIFEEQCNNNSLFEIAFDEKQNKNIEVKKFEKEETKKPFKSIFEQNISSEVFEISKNISKESTLSESAQTAKQNTDALSAIGNEILKTNTSTQNSETKNFNENKSETSFLFKKSNLKFPKMLTKKQIKEMYYEQDQKLFDMSSVNAEECFKQVMNRPSLKQMQQVKQVAVVRKTSDGVIVLPVPEKKRRKRREKITPPLKGTSNLNVSIFSDKNFSNLKESLQLKVKKEILTNDSCFKILKGEVVKKEVTKNNKEKEIEKLLEKSTKNENTNKSLCKTSQESSSQKSANKSLMEMLIEKYLNPKKNISKRKSSESSISSDHADKKVKSE